MTSDPFARSRMRKVLIAIILATIPCYCTGLVAALLAPGKPGLTSKTPTLTSTWTPVVFGTRTPTAILTLFTPTGSATPSPTPTMTATATTTNTPTITQTPTISTTPTPSNTPFLPPTYTRTPIPSLTFTPSPTLVKTSTSTYDLIIRPTDTPP